MGDRLQDQVAIGSIARGDVVPASSQPPGAAVPTAAGQSALGAPALADAASVASRPPGAVDPKASAQLALPGGHPDDSLVRLTRSLRAGLAGSGLRDGGLIAQFPAGVDPFQVFGSPEGAAQAYSMVQGAPEFPETLRDETLEALDGGGPGWIDRRVALMAQDMAAFGGVSREASLRPETHQEGPRFDYFA